MKRLYLLAVLIAVLVGFTGCMSMRVITPYPQHPLNVARQVAKGEASLEDLAKAYSVSGASSSSNAQGGRVCFFDKNSNDRLDDAEILEAIKKWISGEPIDGRSLTDEEILEFIGYWISGKELGCRSSPDFPREEIKKNLDILNAATKYLIKENQERDEKTAREMTLAWIKKQPTVRDAGISSDGTIWIEYTNGLDSFILSPPPSDESLTLSGVVAPFRQAITLEIETMEEQKSGAYLLNATTTNIVTPGNREALILGPFQAPLPNPKLILVQFTSAPEVQKLLTTAGFATRALYREDVTVGEIKELYKYGVIYVHTHGTIDREGQSVFATGERIKDEIDIKKHWDDFSNGRIAWGTLPFLFEIVPYPIWLIRAKFIECRTICFNRTMYASSSKRASKTISPG